MVNPGTNSEILSITTSLLTVLALAVTSKAVLISLPVIMVLDIIDSTTQGEFAKSTEPVPNEQLSEGKGVSIRALKLREVTDTRFGERESNSIRRVCGPVRRRHCRHTPAHAI